MEHPFKMRNQEVPAKVQVFELEMLRTYSFNESAFATTLTQAPATLHQTMPLPACDRELRGHYSTLKTTRQQSPKRGLGLPSPTSHPCNSSKGCGCDPCSTSMGTQEWKKNQKAPRMLVTGPSLTEKFMFQYSTGQQAKLKP